MVCDSIAPYIQRITFLCAIVALFLVSLGFHAQFSYAQWPGNSSPVVEEQEIEESSSTEDEERKRDLELAEQWQTLFTPRMMYVDGELVTTEQLLGCGFGDVYNIKTREIKKIQDVPANELNAPNSPWRYCTVAPIWFGSSQELLLQKENPTLLLDTEKINGQGFMKGATSFRYPSWETEGLGESLFIPGVFPMEENATYRQIPPTHTEAASLGDAQILLNSFPAIFSIGELEKFLPERGDVSVETLISRKDFFLSWQNMALLFTQVLLSPKTDLFLSAGTPLLSIELGNPRGMFADGGATMLKKPVNASEDITGTTLKKLPTSPVMVVEHTEETTDEAASRYATYNDESLLLEPVFRLLSQELENKIRPKADFLCKSSRMYEFSLGEEEHWGSPFLDHSFLFFSDGWKAACASLSGEVYDNKNYHAMVGPFVDQSFNNKNPNETGGMFAATDVTTTFGSTAFMKAQTEPARTSIGNRDTAHMDWFQSAAHCAARGGRLPRTDEVLAMAIDSAENPQTSLFFQSYPHIYPHTYMPGAPTTPEQYLYHGSFVWTGDFVKGTNSEEDQKRQVPFVNALYVPPSVEGNVSQNPNERVALDTYSCDVVGDMTLKRLAARKDSTPFEPHSYIDWNNARLCRVSLDYRVNEAKGHEINGEGRGYFVASAITDPLAQEYEALTLPSAYPASSMYHHLNATDGIPSTHTLCVYD